MINEDNLSSSSIIVVVEWDGQKPSSTFYNRLHEYGLYSKGRNKEEFSLYQWRSSRRGKGNTESKNGMVLQEGLIVVNSLTLAKDIMYWAKKEGAAVVQIGYMNLSDFSMSPEDLEHYRKFETVVSRRGPKPESEKGVYVVTCYDEAKSYEIDAHSIPAMCPMCGGSNIQSRMGRLKRYQPFSKAIAAFDTVETYWLRTRFSSGQFEVPVIADEHDELFAGLPKEIVTAEVPKLSSDTRKVVAKLHTSDLMSVYDAAHVVLKRTQQSREMSRLQIVNSYIMSGGQGFLSWTCPDDGADIVDLCSVNERFKAWLP